MPCPTNAEPSTSYPYNLGDLILAIEIASPGNPVYDYQVKRELYLTSGVPEYWIVNVEARLVSRWRAFEDPGRGVQSRDCLAASWHAGTGDHRAPRPLRRRPRLIRPPAFSVTRATRMSAD